MNRNDKQLLQQLENEIPLLRAQIQALYQKLDKQFGLSGAKVPITFNYKEDSLGSYTRRSKEHGDYFSFSLLFIGYGVAKPLLPQDREDLYRHEYAHYMQYNMEIPREHQWNGDVHGSAWKYCCSLVNAAPTPYYRVGESLRKHNFENATRNPWKDPNLALKDQLRREKEYQNKKNSAVQYALGELVRHPKFGEGIVEEILPQDGGVHLVIRFDNDVKKIDQKWLLKTKYKKMNER